MSRIAWLVLWITYAAAYCVSRMLRTRRPRRSDAPRIAVIGAFHNPGWRRSHLRPIAECGAAEVLVVTDEPSDDVAGATIVHPPAWLTRLTGRSFARLALLTWICLTRRPHWCVGYHLFPAAAVALIAARLSDGRAVYQMTAGPIEFLGGGYGTENRLMHKLGQPSPRLEALAVRLIREFDLTVVRGPQAEMALRRRGVDRVRIITGSLPPGAPRPAASLPRSYDLVFTGRLTHFKRPLLFLHVVEAVGQQLTPVRALMIGDGPLLPAMRTRASEMAAKSNGHVRIDVVGQCDDVMDRLAQSRIFVLTSRSEGLSIALGEAMAAGAVPVVPDIGELASLVRDGDTGFLTDPQDVSSFVDPILHLLRDREAWCEMSRNAARAAQRMMALPVVTQHWRQAFGIPTRAASEPVASYSSPARPAGRRAPRPILGVAQ